MDLAQNSMATFPALHRMTSSQDFSVWQAAQNEIKTSAIKEIEWTDLVPLDHSRARWPGLHKRKIIYKSGDRAKPGALPFTSDVVMHESIKMALSDGVAMYSDIFLPGKFQDLEASYSSAERVPAIISWSPYSKQKGITTLDDIPLRAGVPKSAVSETMKWEAPDPAYWCQHSYAVVNVDIRGSYASEGDLHVFGYQEAQDGSEFVTWCSEQPWCNGKVALAGNSWLAIAQWKIASLRPRGLAAIAPWEGFSDLYRDHMCPGGIPFTGFWEDILNGKYGLAGSGKVEDVGRMAHKFPLHNHYWRDKEAHVKMINVPVYCVASWTNPIHTPGTLKAWRDVPDSTPKWLRIHNKMEWPDFYQTSNQEDLRRFYDFYLKDRSDNGWLSTPKVRMSILRPGLSAEDTINRAESEFPLARTSHRRLYLETNGQLSFNPPNHSSSLRYNSVNGCTSFLYTMPEACETTGYFTAHLVMSAEAHDEMDVFVQVEKLAVGHGYRQGTMIIQPSNPLVYGALKLMHDWQIGVQKVGILFHWGPEGCLRASHVPSKDEERSAACGVPFYTHKSSTPLKPGEMVTMDIPLRPYGMFWEKGDVLKFTVSGNLVNPFPLPLKTYYETNNKGNHVIHCGGRGEDSSYITVPHV